MWISHSVDTSTLTLCDLFVFLLNLIIIVLVGTWIISRCENMSNVALFIHMDATTLTPTVWSILCGRNCSYQNNYQLHTRFINCLHYIIIYIWPKPCINTNLYVYRLITDLSLCSCYIIRIYLRWQLKITLPTHIPWNNCTY